MAGSGAFKTHLFLSLPQEEEKNFKKIFNTSTIFDFISNYTNYIHYIYYMAIIPHRIICLQLISLLGDLKCS